MGGNPLQITVNTMSITRVYSSVTEFSTPSLLSRRKHSAVRLRCQKGKNITAIEFASYGNPVEDCRGSGRNCHGSCHAETSEFVVKNVKLCLPRSYMLMSLCTILLGYYRYNLNDVSACFALSDLPRQKEVRYSSTGRQIRRWPVPRDRKIPFSCGKLRMSRRGIATTIVNNQHSICTNVSSQGSKFVQKHGYRKTNHYLVSIQIGGGGGLDYWLHAPLSQVHWRNLLDSPRRQLVLLASYRVRFHPLQKMETEGIRRN